MEWVSVEERSPRPGNRVYLVWSELYGDGSMAYMDKDDGWCSAYTVLKVKGVTHWARITKPKKGE